MRAEDGRCLRALCARLKELAAAPENQARRRRWADHNDLLRHDHTLLWICPDEDGAWLELIPPETLSCADPELRALEYKLRKYLYHADHFADDFVFEPSVYWDIPGEYTGYLYGAQEQRRAWGVAVQKPKAGRDAYRLEAFIKDEKDFEPLLRHEVDFVEDRGERARLKEKLQNAVDGLIDIRFQLPYGVLVQSHLIELVHLRGLENLMFDLYDMPDLLHEAIRHMAQSKARLLKKLEGERRLFENRRNVYTGSGALGYTNAPLKADADVMLGDMWGFADAQEFSGVSAGMFERFALENQSLGLNLFGMGCYGCCEPLDDKYDAVFRHVRNLRRVSVSPWSNIEMAAERIGRRAVYSWKPNPATCCGGFDEAGMEALLRRVRAATRNCFVEIILKDIRTCGGAPEHLQRFGRLVRRVFGE